MQNLRRLDSDLFWVGANDRKLALFENVMPIPRGVSYNSYVLLDEQTVLLDTADSAVGHQFFENVVGVLGGRGLDYLVVNHMEPDHCALIGDLLLRYPSCKVVSNAKAIQMIGQFFDVNLAGRTQVVAEGDTLCTGRHTLSFVMAPMVHWPEAMMTYDSVTSTLFSADAFGTFGALAGSIYADEVHFERDWIADARRYYCNIVGKYGAQVQTVLKKAAGLDIKRICPLHGPVWRKDLGYILEKYDKWSRYEAEEQGVMVVYGSMYGNTESAAECVAARLAEKEMTEVALYDVSHTDMSLLVGEAFRWSHIVVAAPTYNAAVYTPIEHFLQELKAHNLQNRTIALIENGTWAPMTGKMMTEMVQSMKAMTVLSPTLTLKSALKESQRGSVDQFVDVVLESMK
ncbi:MAG: FprA family A-type flavoprotein [Bacteroidales bacterium]|nr:FprA family A-type flavoprotein [Bacteroidales bacterium]